MITVLSDLHFQEVARDVIPGVPAPPRNLGGAVWRRLAREIVADAVDHEQREIDVVLAGDIFDLSRTSMWFATPELRPYHDTRLVPAPVATRIGDILQAIAAEPDVQVAAGVFRSLAAGWYCPDDNGDADPERIPVDTVRVHYLPGNHDRLIAASGRLRKLARRILGVEGGEEPLPSEFRWQDVLIRHGHEYDPTCWGGETAASSFGDLVTVDITTRLPRAFRDIHGDDTIATRPTLARIYQRLLEFDDLRPQSALLEFLLATPGRTDEEIWKVIQPVFTRVLTDLHHSEAFHGWAARFDHPWRVDPLDFARGLLSWTANGYSLNPTLFRTILSLAHQVEPEMPAHHAAKEEARIVIAGHTHHPCVTLIGEDRWFLDTGTWRHSVVTGLDGKGFGRVRAGTRATVYRDGSKLTGFEAGTRQLG